MCIPYRRTNLLCFVNAAMIIANHVKNFKLHTRVQTQTHIQSIKMQNYNYVRKILPSSLKKFMSLPTKIQAQRAVSHSMSTGSMQNIQQSVNHP
jgi:hypothetical protein